MIIRFLACDACKVRTVPIEDGMTSVIRRRYAKNGWTYSYDQTKQKMVDLCEECTRLKERYSDAS